MAFLSRLFTITCCLIISACQQNPLLLEQRILSFGTLIDISIATTAAKQKSANKAIEAARKLLKTRHHEWHAWQQGDLFELNKALKKPHASTQNKHLEFLITRSKFYYQASNGLFNPAMGLLIDAWGFHGDKKPNIALINRIKLNIPTMDDLTINKHVISNRNPYTQLDFGAIAKGLAIEQIEAIFKHYGFNNYLINIGGDLSTKGKKHGKAWVAGIQNPFKQGIIGIISLQDNSLFTSGNYQRHLTHNNKTIHHIINPRTGESSSQANAVSVIHKNPLTADVAATALMIAKPSEWQAISRQLALSDYLIISKQQEIWVTNSLFNKLTFNTELKVHIIDE